MLAAFNTRFSGDEHESSHHYDISTDLTGTKLKRRPCLTHPRTTCMHICDVFALHRSPQTRAGDSPLGRGHDGVMRLLAPSSACTRCSFSRSYAASIRWATVRATRTARSCRRSGQSDPANTRSSKTLQRAFATPSPRVPFSRLGSPIRTCARACPHIHPNNTSVRTVRHAAEGEEGTEEAIVPYAAPQRAARATGVDVKPRGAPALISQKEKNACSPRSRSDSVATAHLRRPISPLPTRREAVPRSV
jgi:hypothetical protein